MDDDVIQIQPVKRKKTKPNWNCVNYERERGNVEGRSYLVERRARRREGGMILREAAVCRSFQAMGEWLSQKKWETKRRARSTEGRVTAPEEEERRVEITSDAHTLGSVFLSTATSVCRITAFHSLRSSTSLVCAGTAMAVLIKHKKQRKWRMAWVEFLSERQRVSDQSRMQNCMREWTDDCSMCFSFLWFYNYIIHKFFRLALSPPPPPSPCSNFKPWPVLRMENYGVFLFSLLFDHTFVQYLLHVEYYLILS